jgi:hypothetical protein
MSRPKVVINKRSVRAEQILGLIMHIVHTHVDVPHDAERDLVRELRDQLWADGAQMITEGDRINAGLPPRGIYGLTVDELCIIEAKLTMSMLHPAVTIFPADIGLDKPAP